jgi:hypothetical protein
MYGPHGWQDIVLAGATNAVSNGLGYVRDTAPRVAKFVYDNAPRAAASAYALDALGELATPYFYSYPKQYERGPKNYFADRYARGIFQRWKRARKFKKGKSYKKFYRNYSTRHALDHKTWWRYQRNKY